MERVTLPDGSEYVRPPWPILLAHVARFFYALAACKMYDRIVPDGLRRREIARMLVELPGGGAAFELWALGRREALWVRRVWADEYMMAATTALLGVDPPGFPRQLRTRTRFAWLDFLRDRRVREAMRGEVAS